MEGRTFYNEKEQPERLLKFVKKYYKKLNQTNIMIKTIKGEK